MLFINERRCDKGVDKWLIKLNYIFDVMPTIWGINVHIQSNLQWTWLTVSKSLETIIMLHVWPTYRRQWNLACERWRVYVKWRYFRRQTHFWQCHESFLACTYAIPDPTKFLRLPHWKRENVENKNKLFHKLHTIGNAYLTLNDVNDVAISQMMHDVGYGS